MGLAGELTQAHRKDTEPAWFDKMAKLWRIRIVIRSTAGTNHRFRKPSQVNHRMDCHGTSSDLRRYFGVGGCFDPEFAVWSNGLVRDFRAARFVPVLSDVTAAEVRIAPEAVREGLEHSLPQGGNDV